MKYWTKFTKLLIILFLLFVLFVLVRSVAENRDAWPQYRLAGYSSQEAYHDGQKKQIEREITQNAIKLGGSGKLPNDPLEAYKLILKASYHYVGKYNVDPGPLPSEAACEIMRKYEAGLTSNQISEAKREVQIDFDSWWCRERKHS